MSNLQRCCTCHFWNDKKECTLPDWRQWHARYLKGLIAENRIPAHIALTTGPTFSCVRWSPR